MGIQQLVEAAVGEEGDDDLMEFVSDGEGEEFDEIEAPVKVNTSFPNSLFISGLPKVGAAKFDKLMNVLSKLVDKYGSCEKVMPTDQASGETHGFFIVTYDSAQDAQSALKTLDGVRLDKSHQFRVIKLDDFDEIVNRPEDFEAQRNLQIIDREDFRDWLQDKKFREQFLLRYQQETEIYYHDTMAGQPVLCYGGEREKKNKKIWCDWRVQWSPQGSYIATFHQQGIALWAGPEFQKRKV